MPFTLKLTDWSLNREITSTEDIINEKYFVAYYPLTGREEEKHVHAIPLSGIAFRMETLGMRDPVAVLDLVLSEMNLDSGMSMDSSYRMAVNAYFRSSTEFARNLAESSQSLRGFDLINQVRSMLRGDRPTAMGDPYVNAVVEGLASVRSTCCSDIQRTASCVTIEPGEKIDSFRQAILDLSDTLESMTDVHAERAMQTGAYAYARRGIV